MSEATKAGKAALRALLQRTLSQRSLTMSAQTETDNTELEQLHEMLLDADIVDGPPELRELVQELWPGLYSQLHLAEIAALYRLTPARWSRAHGSSTAQPGEVHHWAIAPALVVLPIATFSARAPFFARS